MGAFDYGGLGNQSINSTGAPIGAPSTATLIAFLDSTQLGTKDLVVGQHRAYRVNWMLGADTNATWKCEVAKDAGLSSASWVDVFYPKTVTSMSAQYVTNHVLAKDQFLRVRMDSTGSGASAFISAEPLV
jgi:hypothetical protein